MIQNDGTSGKNSVDSVINVSNVSKYLSHYNEVVREYSLYGQCILYNYVDVLPQKTKWKWIYYETSKKLGVINRIYQFFTSLKAKNVKFTNTGKSRHCSN